MIVVGSVIAILVAQYADVAAAFVVVPTGASSSTTATVLHQSTKNYAPWTDTVSTQVDGCGPDLERRQRYADRGDYQLLPSQKPLIQPVDTLQKKKSSDYYATWSDRQQQAMWVDESTDSDNQVDGCGPAGLRRRRPGDRGDFKLRPPPKLQAQPVDTLQKKTASAYYATWADRQAEGADDGSNQVDDCGPDLSRHRRPGDRGDIKLVAQPVDTLQKKRSSAYYAAWADRQAEGIDDGANQVDGCGPDLNRRRRPEDRGNFQLLVQPADPHQKKMAAANYAAWADRQAQQYDDGANQVDGCGPDLNRRRRPEDRGDIKLA